jgi:hypothetical protein
MPEHLIPRTAAPREGSPNPEVVVTIIIVLQNEYTCIGMPQGLRTAAGCS